MQFTVPLIFCVVKMEIPMKKPGKLFDLPFDRNQFEETKNQFEKFEKQTIG